MFLTLWQRFLGNERLRRFTVLLFLVGVLYLARSMMNLILLTFIFSFLVISLNDAIRKKIDIPSKLIVIIVYLLMIGGIYLAITIYLPKLVTQTENLVNYIVKFYNHPPKGTNDVINMVTQYISQSDIMKQMRGGMSIIVKYLANIGTMGMTFIMALLLSFFFTIDKDDLFKFSKSFLKGPYSWFFNDVYYFAKIFVNSFGVVLETQFIIALINTAITTTILACMKMPQLFSLALLIFFMSMIPVAGVIISAISDVLYWLFCLWCMEFYLYLHLLCVVHALEAYVLNPKLMSSRTELPIFYTFVVLYVSEHLFGMWGLIVGIPVFTFLLDILGVKSDHIRRERLKKFREKVK